MDHAGVKTALARIMARNVSFPMLLQESQDKITKETIVEQIEKKAKTIGIAPSIVATDILFRHLRSIAKKNIKEHNFSEHEEFADMMKYLLEKKTLAGMELEGNLLQEPLFFSLPLPAIWRLSYTKVISLEQVIKRIYERFSGDGSYLVNGLLDLLIHQKGLNTKPAGDILALLVDLMYSSGSSSSVGQEWQPLVKFAGEVLQSVTEGVLDAVLGTSNSSQPTPNPSKTGEEGEHSSEASKKSGDGKVVFVEVVNLYQLVLESPRVTQEALAGYFSAQLVRILTYRPNIKLAKVLKQQESWCSAKANPTLITLLRKLVVGLGYEEAINILELVLSNDEVNWGCVLTLVATTLTCHRSTATKLKELIDRNIRRGCDELEVEALVVGFLFARHAAQEGAHLFPSYAQWFSSLFHSEATSPAAQKQSFVFLLRFLTGMVPHEPAHCLRAHLTAHIHTPRACHEILQSYNHLARARLQELNEAPLANKERLSPKSKAVEDVERAVKQFSETGKVPSFVSESSIFRETYFRASFLPALLAPRHLPEIPDARAKLIEELYGRGKISQAMLKTYTEACQREATDLLQGVFMDVEEDIVMEEPIDEFSNLLTELITATNCDNHQSDEGNVAASEVLPLLSRISSKIEEMMKSYDGKVKDVSHVTLDARLYDDKLLSSQIVADVMRCLGMVLLSNEGDGRKGVRTGLISQLLSIVSSSVTLQRSLSLMLHHRLSLQHITQEQLRTDGVVLCELYKIEGLFLPVVEATQPNQAPCTLTQHYLNNLPLHTPTHLHQACCILRSWIEWHIVCEGKTAAVPPQPLHLYLSIAPRLPLLLHHNEGSGATTADVYNYLNGSGVPECSRLYFSDDLKAQDCKIPLDTWIQFELKASWGNVPVDVRQTFLYTHLMDKISLCHKSNATLGSQVQVADPPTDDLVSALVLTLIEEGLMKGNASDMLMLVQTTGQYCGEADVCLLEAWHKSFKTGFMESSRTLSFMSICRCVSPSLFLKADKLLELAEMLQTYIHVLQSGIDDIQLSLCDTTFLCACLFTAAAKPMVKNVQVDLCLNSIKPAIVFHWDSLRNLFRSHKFTITKHDSLKNLSLALDSEIPSPAGSLLGEEEVAIRLLSLSLHQAACNLPKDTITGSSKLRYVKWVLAYLALQQVRGNVPYLLKDREKLNVSELNQSIVVSCCQELLKVLETNTSSEVIEVLFPAEDETHLGLRLVPVACIFVVMCMKDGHLDSDIVTIHFETSLIDIMLQCNILLCHTFDTQSITEDNNNSNSNLSKKRILSKRSIPDVDYLSQLNQTILSYLSASSPLILSKIKKTTLERLDPEIKAAIHNRLISKKRC